MNETGSISELLKNQQSLSRYVKFDNDENSQKYYRAVYLVDWLNEPKFNELV